MATHECSACLQETIQGASEVVGFLVLPISSCPASGGVHTWMRKTSTTGYYYFNSLQVRIIATHITKILLLPLQVITSSCEFYYVIYIAYFTYLYFICF